MQNGYIYTFFIFILLCKGSIAQDFNIRCKKNISLKKNHIPNKSESVKLTNDIVLGHINYKMNSSFVKVPFKYTVKILYLRKETFNAFTKMYYAAKQDNIQLKIISGTRNFDEQKAIWERKWQLYKQLDPKKRTHKILEYSSMPGSSRHHWGTDIDLIKLNNSYFETGQGLIEYSWLKENACKFGFYQVYSDKKKNKRQGYHIEKWHWSYLPLAQKYLKYYNTYILYEHINNFDGCQYAEDVDILISYVNGISQKAKEFE